jgi:hypothetical protein
MCLLSSPVTHTHRDVNASVHVDKKEKTSVKANSTSLGNEEGYVTGTMSKLYGFFVCS